MLAAKFDDCCLQEGSSGWELSYRSTVRALPVKWQSRESAKARLLAELIACSAGRLQGLQVPAYTSWQIS